MQTLCTVYVYILKKKLNVNQPLCLGIMPVSKFSLDGISIADGCYDKFNCWYCFSTSSSLYGKVLVFVFITQAKEMNIVNKCRTVEEWVKGAAQFLPFFLHNCIDLVIW